MKKILITTSSFDRAGQPGLAALAAAGYSIVMNPHGRKLSEDEAAGLLDGDVVGMVAGTEPLTRRVLAGATGLKVVSRCGIGLDSVDLAAAGDLGIRVLNTPDAPSLAVAELALGMILNALRRIGEADRRLRRGEWKALMGGLLACRTVGIVGYGRIGRRVARLAQAFGARILAHDAQPFAPDGVAEARDIDSLLAEADVVSLHLPSVAGGPFMDAARIAAMKPGAILVNTARGGLIDEAALAAALQDGRLAGAALDTYAKEPYAGPLAGMETAVLTAHMGSYASEARSIMEREAVENLLKGMAEAGLPT